MPTISSQKIRKTEKMREGIPLDDEDRSPWLEVLRGRLCQYIGEKKGVILGCSCLRKKYRETLRHADPFYGRGMEYGGEGRVKFVLLEAAESVIACRLEKRAAAGSHFMPASLLRSQLEALEMEEGEEGVLRVDATWRPEHIVDTIQASTFITAITGARAPI